MGPRIEPMSEEVDPMVADAVTNVRDRFGAEGLRDLIALAKAELVRVEQAERDLAAAVEPTPATTMSGAAYDSADTQAWLAYTEADPGEGQRER